MVACTHELLVHATKEFFMPICVSIHDLPELLLLRQFCRHTAIRPCYRFKITLSDVVVNFQLVYARFPNTIELMAATIKPGDYITNVTHGLHELIIESDNRSIILFGNVEEYLKISMERPSLSGILIVFCVMICYSKL